MSENLQVGPTSRSATVISPHNTQKSVLSLHDLRTAEVQVRLSSQHVFIPFHTQYKHLPCLLFSSSSYLLPRIDIRSAKRQSLTRHAFPYALWSILASFGQLGQPSPRYINKQQSYRIIIHSCTWSARRFCKHSKYRASMLIIIPINNNTLFLLLLCVLLQNISLRFLQ